MKNVVVVGAGGRMGRTIIRYLLNGAVPELKLAGAVDIWDCPERDKDAGLVAGVREAGVKITSDLAAAVQGADVVIDFSSHHSTVGNCPRCAEWGVPLVIGTTGLTEEELAVIRQCARKIPIVQSPNMSIGVNLLFRLVQQAAAALKNKGYDVEIIEKHHRHKKDSPSGTALGLGRAVAAGMDWDLKKVAVYGREGLAEGSRPAEQIAFHAVRGGDIVGDHDVIFATDGECIELSHRATSRDTFAIGALRAAAWLIGRPPALYTMQDVLGFN